MLESAPVHRAPRARGRGFNLLELMVTLAILGIAALGSFRIAEPILARQRVETFLREVSTQLVRARVEAMRLGTPVVVRVDRESRQVEIFADFSDVDGNRGSDLRFEPENSGPVPLRTVDYRVGWLPFPDGPPGRRIEPWGVDDEAPWGTDAFDGFTEDPRTEDGETYPPIAVFEPDGSIRNVGAFRFAVAPEERTGPTDGNYYEVRVAPEATALVEVRKYVPHDPDELSGYYPRDSTPGKAGWQWF